MIVSRNGDVIFSNGNGPSAETISTIGQTIGQIGSSLTQRQRQFTEVEQKCGKKPRIPGRSRNRWNDCAKEYAKSANIPATTFIDTPVATTTTTTDNIATPKKSVPTWVWITGGVVALGTIAFVIYRVSKK
jgi:hypothetical protein